MLVILAMTLVSCALSELNEARERRAERGEKCYEYLVDIYIVRINSETRHTNK